MPGREILILLHDPNIFPTASVNHCHYQYGQKFTISASQTLNTVLAELIDINSVSQIGCAFFISKAYSSSCSPVATAAAGESWAAKAVSVGLLVSGTARLTWQVQAVPAGNETIIDILEYFLEAMLVTFRNLEENTTNNTTVVIIMIPSCRHNYLS